MWAVAASSSECILAYFIALLNFWVMGVGEEVCKFESGFFMDRLQKFGGSIGGLYIYMSFVLFPVGGGDSGFLWVG